MKRVNWIEEIFLPLGAAVLVVAWLSLWLRWAIRVIATDAAPILSPALMFVLVVLAGLSARFIVRGFSFGLSPQLPADEEMRYARDPGEQARQWILSAGLIAMGGALWLTYGARFPFGFLLGLWDWGHFISPELVMLVACGYVWWRGVVIGQGRLPYQELESTFYNGLTALALLFIINRFWPHLAPGDVWGVILLYFAVGLSALSLASFERARRMQRAATGVNLILNRYWINTLAGIIGSVLLGGLALAALLAPESLARLRPLLDAIDWIAYPFLFVLAFLITAIITPIIALIEWFYSHGLNQLDLSGLLNALSAFRVPEDAFKTVDAILASPVVKFSGRTVVIVVIVIFLLGLIAEALRRFQWLAGKDQDETRENILSRELLWEQLKKLFARSGPAPAAPPPYLTLVGDDPRLLIRRAYQALLVWATAHGWPRPAGQTPLQYATQLTQTNPAADEALATLTQSYLRARYAPDAPTLADARAAENAVAQITTDKNL